MTVKQLARKLSSVMMEAAKTRDKLRDLITEAEDLESDITEALEDMERAADAISRLV